MPCPRCNSHNLWDDNLAWGCNRCDFFTTGGIINYDHPNDTWDGKREPSDHRTVDEKENLP